MNYVLRFVLLTLCINTAIGQEYKHDTVIYRAICKCDTFVYAETIKCIDKYGRKQGSWEYYRDKIHVNKIGKDLKNIQKITEPIMIGSYKDGIKTDKWEYYHLSNLDYFGEILTYPEYSINYFSDGSIEIEKYLGNYKIKYNKDSTIISGRVIRLIYKGNSSSIDTFPNINSYEVYIDSRIIDGKVKIRLWFKDNVIAEFDKNELDNELYALTIGLYDRKLLNYVR